MVLKHRPTCRALHMFGDAKSTSTLRSVGGGISSVRWMLWCWTKEKIRLGISRINSALQQTRNAGLKAGHTRSAAGIFCGWTQFATMSSTWPAIHSVFKRMLTKPVSRGAERKLRRMKMQTFA